MKLPLVVLASSLVVNVALVATFSAKPSLAPPFAQGFFRFGSGATTVGNTGDLRARTGVADAQKKSQRAATHSAEIWPALHSADLSTLVARLRAAGFPPAIVRAIVDAEIERQFSSRIKELTRELNETPYWKPDPSYYFGNSKLFEQISQIYRERSRVLRDLLGKDAFAYGSVDPTAAQRRQYGNLPQAKIDLVQRVNDDYAEMMGQVRAAMQGITLPEDREKLALLEREKHADLAAVLTPEELADYEMRTSSVTSRLRTAFTIMDASEDEFRAIYKIHEQYKDVLYPSVSSGFLGSDVMEKRREAAAAANEQVKAALGDARYAQYQRATDNDFQQLYRLGQRDNVPYDTLVRAYDVRTTASEAATKIYDDRAMSVDEKRTALSNLARDTRAQLLSTLGPTTGPAYAENSRWLSYLDQGRIVTIGPDGLTSSIRSLPTPPPAGTPAPKK
jgi:hypothetical protein